MRLWLEPAGKEREKRNRFISHTIKTSNVMIFLFEHIHTHSLAVEWALLCV